jgi:predicted MPP superfamily phosphohydrolase
MAPIVRRTTITLDSPAMAGKSLRVALVSDIHVGSHGMSAARLDRVISQIMAEKPDAIVLAGDFVNGRHPGDRAIRLDLLEPPRPPSGPAGRDRRAGQPRRRNRTGADQRNPARAGVTVLENDAVRVGPLVMAGGDEYGEARRHFKVTMAKAHALAEANALSENKALAGTGAPIVLVEHTPAWAATSARCARAAGRAYPLRAGQPAVPVLGQEPCRRARAL